MQSAAENRTESSKRRSTRIVQAVPVIVTGVDALGRPFQERTSTLAINCHGGRYQSKHYVLKNMWVTLEVPHPQGGETPRRVRGRVTWIQRPRTVRELFQVAVELEFTGNVWGIAFPPPDWTPFQEGAEPIVSEVPAPVEAETELRDEAAVEPAETPDNVRVFPMPGADPSLALARQMTRMVNEAKQQIQAAVREATARSVEAETRPLLAAVESQLREAAQRAVSEASAAQARQIATEAQARIANASQELLQSTRDAWRRESETHIEASAEGYLARLEKMEQAHAAAFEEQLRNALRESGARAAQHRAELSASAGSVEGQFKRLNDELEKDIATARQKIEWLLEAKARDVFARIEELKRNAEGARSEVAAAAASAQDAWRTRFETEQASAIAAWQQTVERSMDNAAKRTTERLAQQTENAAALFDSELKVRLASRRESLDELANEAQSTLARLREALDADTQRVNGALAQIEEAKRRVEGQAASLDELSRTTSAELRQRFEDILEAESAELARRAEAAVNGMGERLEPVIAAAGEETLSRLGGQLEAQLAPQLDRAREILERLAAGTGSAEHAVREHEQRMRETSEKTTQETITRLHEAVGRFEHDFDEAGRAATSRWVSEIESKATETTHTTFEALLKAAAWYEKKVQTHMQATMEKGTEQAEAHLRQKAGELSGLFATELDHYSRSFVEHAQVQMRETLGEELRKAREEMAGMAGGAVANFENEARAAAQKKFEQFTGEVESTVGDSRVRLGAAGQEAIQRMGVEAAHFSEEFRTRMDRQLADGVNAARRRLEAEVAPLEQGWREQRAAQERQFGEGVARLGDAALEGYKDRLENASNSFLVAAVTRLGQQSQSVVDHMAQTAEHRLQTMTGQLFAGLGETLRQRLLDLSATFSAASPPSGKEER